MQKDTDKYIQGIDTILWINLDRCEARRKSMEELLSHFKIPAVRLSASDGKCENVTQHFKFQIGEKSSKAQYGCLLSHLRAIKLFYDSENENALVLEDDACLDFVPYWRKSIKQIIEEAPKDWEIIQLSFISMRDLTEDYTRWALDSRGYWNFNLYGTLAYVINRKGAEKILNIRKEDKWYLDNQFQHVADEVLYGLTQTYTYRYPMFIWPEVSETTIGEGKNYTDYQDGVRRKFVAMYGKMEKENA